MVQWLLDHGRLMVKRKVLTKVVSITLTAMLVLGLPSSAWASEPNPPGAKVVCPQCQVRDVTIESITPTAKIGYFTDADGVKHAVALRLKQVEDEQRVYFSFLENEEDIEFFKKFSRGEMQEQSRTRAPGLAKTRNVTIGVGWGSWISWNGSEIRLHISHDLALQMKHNMDICTWVTGLGGIVAALLGAVAAGVYMEVIALACTLTGDQIEYWDERGSPGFDICASASPLRAWIEP